MANFNSNTLTHSKSIKESDPKILSILKESSFVVRCDDAYNAFPDLALTKDGKRIVCAWRAADHHVPKEFSRIMSSFSDDDGVTWSPPVVLAESLDCTRELWNCPSLTVLDDGRIALLVDRCEQGNILEMDRTEPPAIMMFTSDNRGETWSEPAILPAYGLCPDRLLVTSDGGWLVSAHWYRPGQKPKKYIQQVWRSDDKGETWEGPYVVGENPEYHLCEVSIIEPNPGTLVAYMRENSSLGYPMFKSISRDGGKTWELTETNLVGGHRPKAGILSDGRVLITYRFFEGGRPLGQTNVFAYIESKNSCLESNRLAQRGRIIPLITDCHPRPDTGYTGWEQMEDGTVILVNYIRGSQDMAYIHGFRLSKELFDF